MENSFLTLNKIYAYNRSFELSNKIWDIVIKWNDFAKFTIGKQIVNSSDSISANIAEGFGRYHKKDKIKFYYYSNGSLLETVDWLKKAFIRKLISNDEYNFLMNNVNQLPKELHQLINFTNSKLKY